MQILIISWNWPFFFTRCTLPRNLYKLRTFALHAISLASLLRFNHLEIPPKGSALCEITSLTTPALEQLSFL
jgi:hypothetical protein